MNSKKSTMFLSDLTVVDHAYIDQEGLLRGGSFHPGFLVEGNIDEEENVVVDFSTIKKSIKSLLDDCQEGFDHKLWIMKGFSECSISPYRDRILIESPFLELSLPMDAVKIFSGEEYSLSGIGKNFAEYLNEKIVAKHPHVKVRCVNTTKAHLLQTQLHKPSYFSYCHGLKNSTSWGCQNNSHGHLSFLVLSDSLELEKKVENENLLLLQDKIALELDQTIFVWRENISLRNEEWTIVEYNSRDRGYFSGKYTGQNKIVILETETTVEFLAEYVYKRWQKELQENHAKVLMLSEGLSKGAYLELPS